MIVPRKLIRAVASAMAILMPALSLPLGSAQAALIGTEQLLAEQNVAAERERIAAFLAREEVRAQMEALGVDPAEALARIDALSDEEVGRIAGHLEELPAGEGAIGALVGAAVFIFLVLLITDLLGLTDVYPFVRR